MLNMNLVEKIRLINVEVDSNMNRHWDGELYDDGTVITRWGRVGQGVQSKTFTGAGESFYRRKIREKERKGYTQAKTVEAGSTTVKSVGSSELHTLAKSQLIKSSNPILENLVQRFVQTNVHKITENTTITYNADTGLFSTPLGIVTLDGIAEARNTLADIAKLVRKKDYGTNLKYLAGQYLRLVPQKVGRKLVVEDLFPDEDAIQKQNDLLDSLKSSNEALDATKTVKTDSGAVVQTVFKVDLDVLDDKKERTRINNFFENSKKAMHGYDNVRVREIFAVKIHDMHSNFNSGLTPIHEVFHGTSQANCLSILKSGLKVSPPSTAAIAGKMFDCGVYGAINSTKSLGYSFGRWGQGRYGDSGWLFVCDFAMGRIFETYSSCRRPTDHDSVWAKSGRGLYNDELIVYKDNQVNIKYLLECK